MIYVFLADGFEEIEALTPVDVLRRAGFDVKTVGVTGKTVTGSHNIPVVADITIEEVTDKDLQGVILPGGMPGTLNLENNDTVQQFADLAVKKGLLLGAICAAPSILGHKGILNGKNATCFPGFEESLIGAYVQDAFVVTDGNIITGKGAGAAMEFALALLEYLKDKQTSEELRKAMCCV